MKNCVYRHFDASGTLLYVGVSLCAVTRLSGHREHSGWFQEIARVTVEWFDSRELALEAERKAIRAEKPKHNKNNVERVDRRRREPQAVESQHALTERLVNFRPLYEPREVASALNLAPRIVNRYIEGGQIGYVEIPNTVNTKMKKYVTGWQLIDFIENLQASSTRAA